MGYKLLEHVIYCHLLIDAISPDLENETTLIEHSKYYDDTEFEHAQQYNSKISMLSINCQSINAKFDKLKLFLDDVNTKNKISAIMCSGDLEPRRN